MRTRRKTYQNLEASVMEAVEWCMSRLDEARKHSGMQERGEALLTSVISHVRIGYLDESDPFKRPTKMTVWRCIQKLAKDGKLKIEKRPIQITIERAYVKLL